MKKTKLIILAALGACFGAPPGFRTANAAADVQKQVDAQAVEIAELKNRLEESAAQDARIAELENRLAAALAGSVAQDSSTLTLLCKGAGVDPADVRWRVAAGLDEVQAVEVAVAQKKSNEAAEAAKKGGK